MGGPFGHFVSMGMINASMFRRFARWAVLEANVQMDTFDGDTLISVGNTPGKIHEQIDSQMCQDFADEAMWKLAKEGATLRLKRPVWRDISINWARRYEEV